MLNLLGIPFSKQDVLQNDIIIIFLVMCAINEGDRMRLGQHANALQECRYVAEARHGSGAKTPPNAPDRDRTIAGAPRSAQYLCPIYRVKPFLRWPRVAKADLRVSECHRQARSVRRRASAADERPEMALLA